MPPPHIASMIRPLLALLLLAVPTLAHAPAAHARDIPGYGTVAFQTSCTPATQAKFEVALARLHSFDVGESAFQDIGTADPKCAIAWWGAAMAVRGNPLAGAPGRATLQAMQADLAHATAPTSDREAGLVAALRTYVRDPAEPQAARTTAYVSALRTLAARYPTDPDIQSFHALAILESVDLTDTTLARQREAGAILERTWAANPHHPGAPHYLIHAYDYPSLAARALPAALAYAAIAPAAPHAQHMPSHIYSMLGLWADSIAANRAAAQTEGAPHTMAAMDSMDPHGMDFITYAHLQLGEDAQAAAALARAEPSAERTIAAARYLLERHDWPGAAAMPARTLSGFDAVTVRFVRALGAARTDDTSGAARTDNTSGAARTGNAQAARTESTILRSLRETILRQQGPYWGGLVDVYADAADAWAARAANDPATALRLMARAADRDDAREKHILLENKLLPMRELYADLLMDLNRPAEALAAYRTSQAHAPNRFNGFLGIARAATALGQSNDARRAYEQAAALTRTAAPGRPEIAEARLSAQQVPR